VQYSKTNEQIFHRVQLTEDETQKEAVLVGISEDDHIVEETKELCSSAGYNIVAEVRQSRDQPHSKFYIGPGKIMELQDLEDVEFLITPADLDPSQVFNMGKASKLTVVDRIRLVLELFKGQQVRRPDFRSRWLT